MARQVQKKAAKDYPQFGIAKGDLYWYADVKTGPRSKIMIRSKTPIPRSRLTGSAFLSAAYDLSDRLDTCGTIAELEEIKDGVEELRDQTQESFDNMPEGLQQGPTGELLQERVDQLESLVSELESAIDAANEKPDDEDAADADEDGDSAEAERVRGAIDSNISSQF